MLSYLPDLAIDTSKIKAIMINEVVADKAEDDFYSNTGNSDYMKTTIPLFQKAGADVQGIDDILALGIYITNMIKLPKQDTTVPREMIEKFVPILEEELSLFSSLCVVMLMGDVAKKGYNSIVKKQSGKNAVPSISTYKLRNSALTYKGIRIFPAYIMTGKNILIEKSKFEMSAEDIGKMLALIKSKRKSNTNQTKKKS
ncbi:MAG: uracil-DNA glycosylase [Clostridiales bacterium]|nr:uracil-DNA glycosylase [Clostridiales bacterium]